jgi:hypothetical protein
MSIEDLNPDDVTTVVVDAVPDESQVETPPDENSAAGDAPPAEVAAEKTAEEKPADTTQADRAAAGILADLQKERDKRHEAEARAEVYREELARQAKPAEPESLNPNQTAFWAGRRPEDDDTPLTAREQRELDAAKGRDADVAREREAKHREQKSSADRFDAADAAGRAAYTNKTVGEGLDYDAVLTAGLPFLTRGDRIDIASARTPRASADIAYDRCIQRVPGLRELALNAHVAKRLEGKTAGQPAAAGGKPKPTVPRAVTSQHVLGAPQGIKSVADWLAET